MFSRKRVTLHIESDSLRVLITKGRKVRAWGSLALEPGLVKDDLVVAPEEVGQSARGLLHSIGTRRGRLIGSVGGFSSVARHITLPLMPRKYMPKAVVSELEQTIPLALRDVHLSWQSFANGRTQQVLAVCVPIDVMEAQVRALRSAGLRPTEMELKPLALARAANRRDVLIVNLEREYIDIVLVLAGMPQIMRTVPMGLSALDPEARAEAVVDEVERTLAFYEESASTGQPLDSLPVMFTGYLALEGELLASVRPLLSRPVEPFAPPVGCPAHFPAAQYAVNVGMALRSVALPQPRDKSQRFQIPSIDVLPERLRPSPFPWRQVAIVGGLALLAALLLPISQQLDSTAAQVDVLEGRLGSLERQVRLERLRLQRMGEVEAETQAIEATTGSLEQQLRVLAQGRQAAIDRLQGVTVDALSPGVTIVGVSDVGEGVTIRGSAGQYQDALQYAANLRASGLFSRVWLQSAQETSDGLGFVVIAQYQQGKGEGPLPMGGGSAEEG